MARVEVLAELKEDISAAHPSQGPRKSSIRVELEPSGLRYDWHRGNLDFELGEKNEALILTKLQPSEVTIEASEAVQITVGEKVQKLAKGKKFTVSEPDMPVKVELPEKD